jgi:hypothetical protein
MIRSLWLPRLRGLFPGTREVRRQRPECRPPCRPRLEALEDRTLLSFSQPILSEASVGPTAVAVGDFNGDGNLDLVTANVNNNTVSVLFGRGDGTFQAPVNYAVGANPVRAWRSARCAATGYSISWWPTAAFNTTPAR